MLGRRKTAGKDSLDQRWLGIAPRVSDVDDEWNPAIVQDSLWVDVGEYGVRAKDVDGDMDVRDPSRQP